MEDVFRRFALHVSHFAGRPWAFAAACATIVVWALSGPVFGFSDSWQLAINTGTTILTFLMVFLIQNTQNRDARAIHLKLDELVRATEAARNELLDIEEMPEAELMKLHHEFQDLRRHYEETAAVLRLEVQRRVT